MRMHNAFYNNSNTTMKLVKQAPTELRTCANISAYDNGSLSDIFWLVIYHTESDQTNLLYMQF